ncbi:Fe(2+) transport protein A [Anaerolineae bacterium]|nr:Fe(2+) transport protein A [Anaerolineae bacterium]
MTPTLLSSLTVGRRARVLEVGGDDQLQQRLLEFGILPGVEVRLVRVAPLGDPIEIEVLGYSLSLRKSEAAHVHIEALS